MTTNAIEDGSQQFRRSNIVKADQELVKPMDLRAARDVLNRVVNTHESLVVDGADLTRIGGIDYKEIRQALTVVGKDIYQKFDRPEDKIPDDRRKSAPEGEIRFLLYTGMVGHECVELLLHKKGDFIIRAKVPLQDSSPLNEYSGFFDYRQDKGTNYRQFRMGFNTERVRIGWRGVRWMAANMLAWEGPRILPEDLDKAMLPPPQLPGK